MPRIVLTIESQLHRIDSPNYEAVGQWFAHVLSNYRIDEHVFLELRVYPFFVPDPRGPQYPYLPDTNADTRYFDTFGISETNSPADAMRKLADLLTTHAERLDTAP